MISVNIRKNLLTKNCSTFVDITNRVGMILLVMARKLFDRNIRIFISIAHVIIYLLQQITIIEEIIKVLLIKNY